MRVERLVTMDMRERVDIIVYSFFIYGINAHLQGEWCKVT